MIEYGFRLTYNTDNYVCIESYNTNNYSHNNFIFKTKSQVNGILDEILKQYKNEIDDVNYPNIVIDVTYKGDNVKFHICYCDIWINHYMISVDINNWIDSIDKAINEIKLEV